MGLRQHVQRGHAPGVRMSPLVETHVARKNIATSWVRTAICRGILSRGTGENILTCTLLILTVVFRGSGAASIRVTLSHDPLVI